MGAALQEELVDTVYRAALEPDAWKQVVALMGRRFPSAAQTFYFLHLRPHRVQPVCLAGIDAVWVRRFDETYFARDNPWIRLSPHLHRPGIVRTNERLDRVLRTRGALYRSAYYNEWMRPQGLKYTIGNTLLAEGGVVANVTLLRAPDMPTFGAAEVRAFQALSRHMTRALQVSLRLQCLDHSPAGTAALDALPQAVAVVDARRRVVHANPAMQSLLARGGGLKVCQGELCAMHAAAQPALAAQVAAAVARVDAGAAVLAALHLPLPQGGHLVLHAMPLAGGAAPYLPWRPMVMLLAQEPATCLPIGTVCRQHGCTPAESRLAGHLALGRPLREAAQAMGITYGTARAYLKLVFDKLGVRSQAQLVARLLGSTGEHATMHAPDTGAS